MHFANRSKNTRNRLEILLATSAVVLIFFRDPVGVPGGPYKVDKSLRDVPSRGGLQEAPQGGPGGTILVDFEFFQHLELLATQGVRSLSALLRNVVWDIFMQGPSPRMTLDSIYLSKTMKIL